jgi:acetyl esterase
MSRWSTHKRFGLTLEGMVEFAHAYVDEADSADWRVSPKRAADLTGVAPAVIHTSTLDVLRTEGNFFADDLRAAGVRVIAREHPSLNHSYFGLGGVSGVADAAAAQAADDLREILGDAGQ